MLVQHSASLVHGSWYSTHSTHTLFTHTSSMIVLPGRRQHDIAPAPVEQASPRDTQVGASWQMPPMHCLPSQHGSPNPSKHATPSARQGSWQTKFLHCLPSQHGSIKHESPKATQFSVQMLFSHASSPQHCTSLEPVWQNAPRARHSRHLYVKSKAYFVQVRSGSQQSAGYATPACSHGWSSSMQYWHVSS